MTRPLVVTLLCALLVGQATAYRTLRRLQQNQSNTSKHVQSLLVLGDSVSDAGLPHGIWSFDNQTYPYAQFGYYQGRFSDGPVWPEYLAAAYNLTLVDYAVGGATVNKVAGRVALSYELREALTYLHNTTLPSPVLGVIAIGGNDLADLDGTVRFNISNVTAVLQWTSNVINGSISAAQQLLDAGVDSIVFIPTFDALKDAPLTGLLSLVDPAYKQLLYNLVYIMNKEMSAAVGELRRAHPGTTILYIDVGPELHDIGAHPGDYGLVNGNASCLTFNPPGSGFQTVNGTMVPAVLQARCANSSNYFFWDVLHPTTAGHKLVAGYISSMLRKVGLLP